MRRSAARCGEMLNAKVAHIVADKVQQIRQAALENEVAYLVAGLSVQDGEFAQSVADKVVQTRQAVHDGEVAQILVVMSCGAHTRPPGTACVLRGWVRPAIQAPVPAAPAPVTAQLLVVACLRHHSRSSPPSRRSESLTRMGAGAALGAPRHRRSSVASSPTSGLHMLARC